MGSYEGGLIVRLETRYNCTYSGAKGVRQASRLSNWETGLLG